jgi:hypothetical protein
LQPYKSIAGELEDATSGLARVVKDIEKKNLKDITFE